jgi:hypothetical protein
MSKRREKEYKYVNLEFEIVRISKKKLIIHV